MRKLFITMAAALAIAAAAAVPAAASADPGPLDAPGQSNVGFRPTAIEYGLIYASAAAGPAADTPVSHGVLESEDDPAFDPGFGGGDYIDAVLVDDPNAEGAGDAPGVAWAGMSLRGAD
jgi:hypothetical protein